MTDSHKRMNKIVSKALSLSPIAREIHDDIYKTGYYKYAVLDKSVEDGNPAYIEVYYDENGHLGKDSVRLILSMNYSDSTLVSAVTHELIHVAQYSEMSKKNIQITAGTHSLTDTLASRLVQEAHAFTCEVEGPLLGFFRDLSIGKTENIADYKAIFSRPDISSYTKLYLGGLFDEAPQSGNTDKMIDLAGYSYLNRFLPLGEKEKANAFTNARKSVVKGFFQQNSLKNNHHLDLYIADITMSYKNYKDAKGGLSRDAQMDKFARDFETVIGNSFFNPYNVLKQNVKYPPHPVSRPATLAEVTSITNIKGTFLSNKDWSEVLRADTPEKLIGGLFMGSQHKQFITDVRNKYTP